MDWAFQNFGESFVSTSVKNFFAESENWVQQFGDEIKYGETEHETISFISYGEIWRGSLEKICVDALIIAAIVAVVIIIIFPVNAMEVLLSINATVRSACKERG